MVYAHGRSAQRGLKGASDHPKVKAVTGDLDLPQVGSRAQTPSKELYALLSHLSIPYDPFSLPTELPLQFGLSDV